MLTVFKVQITGLLHKVIAWSKSWVWHGIKNEPDESNQKLLILLNLDSVIVFVVCIFMGLLLGLSGDAIAASSFFASGLAWLLTFYFNRNGLTLNSRIWVVLYTNSALFLSCCWFSHNLKLDNFFLIAAINCMFLFRHTEKPWLFISVFLSLGLFVIESTNLQEYLPAFNRVQNVIVSDWILLSGQISIVSLLLLAYIYVNTLKENSILEKQKTILKAHRAIEIQNQDLKTFSIAASHNMQTSLHVALFFLKKISNDSVLRNADFDKNIEMVSNGLGQIELMVSGLFSYNRIINIENEKVLINVANEINSIKKASLNRYPGANIIVRHSHYTIVVNQFLFSTIMHVLIDNGLKYNTSSSPWVLVEIRGNPDKVQILVFDNGIGISEQFFETVFEPFKRLDTKIKSEGNGLGLALARRAAERLNGSVSCLKSNSGGSIFKLEISTLTHTDGVVGTG